MIFFMALLATFAASADDYCPSDSVAVELSDEALRENPEFDDQTLTGVDSDIDLSVYPFLHNDANHIMLNGADWSSLMLSLDESLNQPVSIVHLGNSHIQADMLSGHTRRLLRQRYGNYGRGLIVPLRLAGTNQPVDYSFSSDSHFTVDRLLSYPWSEAMGFTGIALTPQTDDFSFTVSAGAMFERIVVYYTGSALSAKSVTGDGASLVFTTTDSPGCLEIALPFPCGETTLTLSALGPVSIFGVSLYSDAVGLAYNAIGINGATCASYNRVAELGSGIALLAPDLIIVSLGTNEAFGRFDPADFSAELDRLVTSIRNENPGVHLLLTTPAECYRRIRRRRRRSYVVNDRIAHVRQAILDYGRDNAIAVYDWYDAAGGAGSAAKWLSSGLLGRDRVHCTRTGYQVAGQMLYDALIQLQK